MREHMEYVLRRYTKLPALLYLSAAAKDHAAVARFVGSPQRCLFPWLPEGLAPAVKETVRSIEGCSRLPVYQTTLFENATWQEFGLNAGE
jgi:hypothetical protein